jgi:hypothetical protein
MPGFVEERVGSMGYLLVRALVVCEKVGIGDDDRCYYCNG